MTDFAGGKTYTTTSASAQLIENRQERRLAFSITNYGTNTAWLMLSNTQAAAVGTGIPLYAGETIVDGNSDIYKCWQGSIAVIQDTAGTTTLSVWERVSL